MKKVKIGVIGIGRGRTMIEYASTVSNAILVAICDFWEEGLMKLKEETKDDSIQYFTNYEEFLKYDMDAVVLANYATEHAKFAIQALEAGKHVLSEVLPIQTLAEAVMLCEAVEKSDKIYAYAENYCYMPSPMEMKKLYREGKLGNLEYAESEYIHNCHPIWADITYGDKEHWRNHMYATYYATHSIGPILHITGLRPTKVIGFELPRTSRAEEMGKLGGTAGIEMITLENGAILKSIHGDLAKNSIWFSLYGTKGRMESAREDALKGDIERIYTNFDEVENEFQNNVQTYLPKTFKHHLAKGYGHGGSDFYTMHHFIEKIKGNPLADTIDVYEALDMFLPGYFAYQSILQGGSEQFIPNFRNKEEREKYRYNFACTDPLVAGDQVFPCYSKGNPDIPQATYDKLKAIWLEKQSK
ncbi:MAG: Gfo/Idh/MocA family protein [Candidatus Izemoplasmatales bacterium]